VKTWYHIRVGIKKVKVFPNGKYIHSIVRYTMVTSDMPCSSTDIRTGRRTSEKKRKESNREQTDMTSERWMNAMFAGHIQSTGRDRTGGRWEWKVGMTGKREVIVISVLNFTVLCKFPADL
jgi:hypothetical protein